MSENLHDEYACGEGWHPIIDSVVKKINAYNEDKADEDKVNILQIKEKFGGLRIYVRPRVEEIAKAIEDAEIECSKTCEECGSKINVSMTRTSSYWLRTLCHDCYENKLLVKDKDAIFYPPKN